MTVTRCRLLRGALTAAALSVLGLAGSDEASAGVPADGSCPVPICGLAGTSRVEDDVDGQFFIVGEATVRWTFHRMDGRDAVYLASGTVSASWRHEGCSIDLHPAKHEFETRRGESDGELRIDFSQRPWQYVGSGSSEWEGRQVWCPGTGDEHVHEGVLALWFDGAGIVNSDPEAAVMGEMEQPHRKSAWKFASY
jgi:hypothetical protein